MKAGHGLLGAAVTLFLVVVSVRAAGVGAQNAPGAAAAQTTAAPPASTPTHYPAIPAGTTSADYIGSNNCGSCHKDAYLQWRKSLHIQMTKPIAEATVLGDFSDGATLRRSRPLVRVRHEGRQAVRVGSSFGDRAPETFSVDYTLGAKRYQGYLSTLPDGRIYVLPVFWHVASKRWVDWKEITPIPDGAHDLRQIWNANCFNCHATNIAQGYDVATKRYTSTWTEMGIGCEACHGPGRQHVASDGGVGEGSRVEARRTTTARRTGSSATSSRSSRRAAPTPRRIYDTCAYCHGNKHNVFVGFQRRRSLRRLRAAVPDQRAASRERSARASSGPTAGPNRFNRPQALTLERLLQGRRDRLHQLPRRARLAQSILAEGEHQRRAATAMRCARSAIRAGAPGTRCCVPAAPRPREPHALAEPRAVAPGRRRSSAHTFHAADSAGSRCISCHMSDVNWRLLIRRRDHTFQPPVPENTAQFGMPERVHHLSRRSHAGVGGAADGHVVGRRRARAARRRDAGRHDVSRRFGRRHARCPALAKLAVDRSQGLLIRASAAEFIGAARRSATGGATAPASDAQSSDVVRTRRRRRDGERRQPRRPPSAPDVTPAHRERADRRRRRSRAGRARVGGRRAARHDWRSRAHRSRRSSRGSSISRASCAPRPPKSSLASASSNCPERPARRCARRRTNTSSASTCFPDVASNHAAKGWLEAERGNVDRGARRARTRRSTRRTELRVSVGGEGRAAGEGRQVRRGGGDVEEGPIDRAFLPEHRSAHCGSGEET